MHWPERIPDAGGLRSQFTHVIDIGPTILEAAGIPQPTHVDGVEQQPMHGTSFVYSLDDATAAERHTQQYFENLGNRAMYKDGWWLVDADAADPVAARPRDAARSSRPASGTPTTTRSSCTTCRTTSPRRTTSPAEHPEKVEELKQLFWEEAEQYQVLPLLGGLTPFFGMLPPIADRHDVHLLRRRPERRPGMIPRIYNHSYTISADLEIPAGGAEGVIVAEADHLGGFALFVQDGKLRHTYSFLGVFEFRQESDEPLPSGEVNVRMEFAADAPKPATGGEVTLYINDEAVGGGRMEHTVRFGFSRLRRHGHRPRQRPAPSTAATPTSRRSRSPARSRRSSSTSTHTSRSARAGTARARHTSARRARDQRLEERT